MNIPIVAVNLYQRVLPPWLLPFPKNSINILFAFLCLYTLPHHPILFEFRVFTCINFCSQRFARCGQKVYLKSGNYQFMRKAIVYSIVSLNTLFFLYAGIEGSVYSSVVFSEILLIVLYLLSNDKTCLKLFAIPLLVSAMLAVSPSGLQIFLYFALLILAFTLPPVCSARCLKVLDS